MTFSVASKLPKNSELSSTVAGVKVANLTGIAGGLVACASGLERLHPVVRVAIKTIVPQNF
jgi:hypothetical protein